MSGTLLRPFRGEPHLGCEVLLWVPQVVRLAFIASRREREHILSKSIASETVLLFRISLSLIRAAFLAQVTLWSGRV
jgi:hypothetical protein